MGEMNLKRIGWAMAALDGFSREVWKRPFSEVGEDERPLVIKDLICNLLHVARGQGVDAANLARLAVDIFEGEVADDE